MAFSTFFNSSLNLAIGVHGLSYGQLPALFLLTVWSFSIFGCKEYNQSDFGIDHLIVSIYRVFSCVDGHEFEQALGVGNGQGSLVCCNPWG